MKNIAILGSTGSIGINALDVISRLRDRFKIIALSADNSLELLSVQARKFRPKVISIGSQALAVKARSLMPSGTGILHGQDGLSEIVSRGDVDMVLFAISGTACLVPLIDAIRCGKEIALANKESLVCGGPLIMKMAAKNRVRILPVDSEHSAIFQCINGSNDQIARIYLTGSGGPLLNVDRAKFDSIPVSGILKHPRWKMGKKISVDSATMMNKGLEIIEAKYLFDINESSIEVLVHPEAIVHSMVEFSDRSVIAQLGTPDMRLPIEYALMFPERSKPIVKSVDFAKIGSLTFRRPDTGKFPCLGLARSAAASGGVHPAILCASDEEAVASYLAGSIRFSDIPKIIEKVLARHKKTGLSVSIKDILEADRWAREETKRLCCH